jgi:hypothetical protein
MLCTVFLSCRCFEILFKLVVLRDYLSAAYVYFVLPFICFVYHLFCLGTAPIYLCAVSCILDNR